MNQWFGDSDPVHIVHLGCRGPGSTIPPSASHRMRMLCVGGPRSIDCLWDWDLGNPDPSWKSCKFYKWNTVELPKIQHGHGMPWAKFLNIHRISVNFHEFPWLFRPIAVTFHCQTPCQTPLQGVQLEELRPGKPKEKPAAPGAA